MAHAARTINGTATRATKCAACSTPIVLGERVHMRRERALTSAHACHAGTLYPYRIECRACCESWNARFADSPVAALIAGAS